MIKKIGILTLCGNTNYGNRLQNYALKRTIDKFGYNTETIWKIETKKTYLRLLFRHIFKFNKKIKRYNKFVNFSNRYLNIRYYNDNNINYDKIIVGSDQVWSPELGLRSDIRFLPFSKKENNIAYSASFGVNEIPDDKVEFYKDGFMNFKGISVREEQGKKIINKICPSIDVKVTLDPTMLLTSEEWSDIIKCPKKMIEKKYILTYFLGKLDENVEKEINRVAKENDCEIINMFDKNSKYYYCGPEEFLYLEKNAFLICTDSFHSSVFAFIFNKPFIVFEREQKGISSMNSRIETLLNTFELNNRKFNGKSITKDNLNHDYMESYIVLKNARQESIDYLQSMIKEN